MQFMLSQTCELWGPTGCPPPPPDLVLLKAEKERKGQVWLHRFWGSIFPHEQFCKFQMEEDNGKKKHVLCKLKFGLKTSRLQSEWMHILLTPLSQGSLLWKGFPLSIRPVYKCTWLSWKTPPSHITCVQVVTFSLSLFKSSHYSSYQVA